MNNWSWRKKQFSETQGCSQPLSIQECPRITGAHLAATWTSDRPSCLGGTGTRPSSGARVPSFSTHHHLPGPAPTLLPPAPLQQPEAGFPAKCATPSCPCSHAPAGPATLPSRARHPPQQGPPPAPAEPATIRTRRSQGALGVLGGLAFPARESTSDPSPPASAPGLFSV